MARAANLARREVLDRAVEEFWRRGFRAASIDALVREIGTTRFSLYREFGGKDGLFEAALDHYAEHVVTRVLAPMTDTKSGLAGIARYFDDIIGSAERDGRLGRGCLMTNTMAELGEDDRRSNKRTKAHFERVTATFEAALSRARQRGEIAESVGDLAGLAFGFATFAQGVWACARSGIEAKTLRRSVRSMLRAIRRSPSGEPVSAA